MAITTSRGYPGLVTATDWAILSRHQGQSYAVLGHDHLVASKGTGDRGVKISAGVGLGHGVMDENVGDVNLNAAVMSSPGSRWDTVALERDWATETSSFVILTGNASRAISSARLRNVGTGKDHQPLWLIRVDNGQTDIADFVDLRVWQQDGGLYAADPLARDYMNALGTDMLCKNDIRYIRVIDPVSGLPVWSEHRKVAFGPRPTAYARRTVGALRPLGRSRIGGADFSAFYDGGGDSFTWVAGDFGSVGAQFITKKPGMYSLWGNARISSNTTVNADLLWGSPMHPPIGGLPGSPGTSDAATTGSSMADVSGDAYRTLDLHAFRYLEAGAVISLSYDASAPCIIENWQLWAQRVSD